jgi:hypothetical protein
MSKKLSEKQRNIQQIPFRLHTNDHKHLKSKTALEGIKIQTLVEACILAYLDGDEHVKNLAKEHKVLNTVNKKKASWSRREQSNLLDEIENVVEGGEDE